MTQKQLNRMKLSAVCSLQAYEWLQKWIIERHPGNPYPGEPKTYFYRNTTHRQYLSKFLESVIIKVLRSKGANPIKAVDSGKFVDTSKIVTDVTGGKRSIGSGNWVRDYRVKKGTADITCYFNGSMGCGMYNMEIKAKKDVMSDMQKKEQTRAEANGEFYVIIKNVDNFKKIL